MIRKGSSQSSLIGTQRNSIDRSLFLKTQEQNKREEARCLEIEEIQKEKVIKHGKMKKKKGFMIKNFKEYEIFLMKNGFILFYTLTESSKNYGQESISHRLQLDETMRIDNERIFTDKDLKIKI